MSAVRAVFSRDDKEIDIKQSILDNALSKLDGIKFFISAATATVTNAKCRMDPGMRQQRHLTPGVSYFICHQDLKTDSIFACMHDNELEFELKSIRNNSRKKMDRTDELVHHLKKNCQG